MIEKVISTPQKKIRIRRALILGNFYDKEVQIIRASTVGEESFRDTVIGITSDALLTKKGRSINLSTIQSIYQL